MRDPPCRLLANGPEKIPQPRYTPQTNGLSEKDLYMTSIPILIAGGGQKGYQVRLLEQTSKFGEAGAGIQLGPNVFKMFKILGLTEAKSDLAVFPDELVMRDGASGGEITRIPVNITAF